VIAQNAMAASQCLRCKLCSQHGSRVLADIVTFYTTTRLHWHAKQVRKDIEKKKTAVKSFRKKSKLV